MSLNADTLLGIKCELEFNEACLQTFHSQYREVAIYRTYVDLLKVDIASIKHYSQIPFLPISFFKSQQVLRMNAKPVLHFESSGTTSEKSSKHFVVDTTIYNALSVKNFEAVYGSLSEYCILALLPSYLERGQSSLVYMVQHFMNFAKNDDAGFYLNDLNALSCKLDELMRKGQKVLLIGVTYALLDFAESFPKALLNTVIMETGGMKGRRKEMLREEVHATLKNAFHVDNVHSEYGMTELLSQAYAPADGVFTTPNWMRVLLRDPNDPLSVYEEGSGVINIIDLANQDSCAFIATDDLGVILENSKFKVLGRLDNAELRGCNLLVQ